MAEDRVTMRNPNTGRDDTTIARAMYEPVRDAILGALADADADADDDAIAFGDLRRHVEARTSPDLWTEASVGWYTTTVKLHLEAEGLLQRSGSPQLLRLTDRGRHAIAANR